MDADDENNPGIIGDRLEEFRDQPLPAANSSIDPASGVPVIPTTPTPVVPPSSSVNPAPSTQSQPATQLAGNSPSSGNVVNVPVAATTPTSPVTTPTPPVTTPAPTAPATATTATPSITESSFQYGADLDEGWSVRLGVFGQERNALALENRLNALDYDVYIEPFESTREFMAAVYVGPVPSRQDASDLVVELRSAVGIEGVVQAYGQ
jgi:cell division septation protein DedD